MFKSFIPNFISMYEFVMVYIASELGNIGEYQLAFEIDQKILSKCMACKRVWVLDDIIYNILWNQKEKHRKAGKLIEKQKMTEGLKQCVLLSHFCKRSFYEKFYQEKLHQS